MAPVRAAALLLVVCLLAAGAQCRVIVDSGHNEDEKINLPYGLCAYKKRVDICKSHNLCYCCLTGYWCYETMEGCQQKCQ